MKYINSLCKRLQTIEEVVKNVMRILKIDSSKKHNLDNIDISEQSIENSEKNIKNGKDFDIAR